MSSGSPVGCEKVRQRHSQGDGSGGDEDDASSKSPRAVPSRMWSQGLVSVVWVGLAGFMIYYGDRRETMISILWSDERVRRTPLYIGLAGGLLNVGLILFTLLCSQGPQKSSDKYEAILSTAPSVVVLGFLSFCLISFALWPIWGILTILLLITLLMSFMVVLSYLISGPPETESHCDARFFSLVYRIPAEEV